MMQQSDMGIVVAGDEADLQIAYADIVILKLEDMWRLMFWHGRGHAQRLTELTTMTMLKSMVLISSILGI